MQVRGLIKKVFKMRTQDIEKMLVGSIKEIMRDRRYFYYSQVGPAYSQFTEEGRQALVDVVGVIAGQLAAAIAEEDIERSKKIVLDQLKGN
jgi:hypothetical protein